MIMKILVTGGHHTTAVAVIQKLKETDETIQVIFVGSKKTMEEDESISAEYKDITFLGIPFFDINAGKFYRKTNLKAFVKIISGFFRAFNLLINEKPDGIISFGGYIAVPVVFSGAILGIPCVTHEQTAICGLANKFISNFVKKVFISWEESRKYFPKEKVIFSGLPLREAIFKNTSSKFEIYNELPTIYVTGGKQGSVLINGVVAKSLERLLTNYNVIHQCGDNSFYKDYEKLINLKNSLSKEFQERYFVEKYIESKYLGEVFAKSSLIISRAGANSVYEFIALHKNAILIPISWVSYNEQNINAQLYKKTGLGEVLEEKDLSEEKLVDKVNYMLNNLDKYRANESTILNEDAGRIIADECVRLFSSKKS